LLLLLSVSVIQKQGSFKLLRGLIKTSLKPCIRAAQSFTTSFDLSKYSRSRSKLQSAGGLFTRERRFEVLSANFRIFARMLFAPACYTWRLLRNLVETLIIRDLGDKIGNISIEDRRQFTKERGRVLDSVTPSVGGLAPSAPEGNDPSTDGSIVQAEPQACFPVRLNVARVGEWVDRGVGYP
jgi:hypothetical protein